MTEFAFIEAAVPLPLYNTYTYSVPEHLQPFVEIGKRVLVPLGSRKVTGYILAGVNKPDTPGIKPIAEIIDEAPLFPAAMVPLFRWMADYYLHPLGEVIKEALPGGINVDEYITLHITDAGRQALCKIPENSADQSVLCRIADQALRMVDLSRHLDRPVSHTLICRMEKEGLLIRCREIKKPVTRTKTERWAALSGAAVPEDGLSPEKRRIMDELRESGEMPVSSLKSIEPRAASLIRSLEKKGFVLLSERPVYRDPFGESIEPDTPPELTEEQAGAVAEVLQSLGREFKTFLLAGVTGSGKTEVYMRLAAAALERGRSALVLVPEIALISEIERRFRARFGDCIAVLHSGLSAGERYDQWRRIINQECRIAIGARSAIFAPLSDIGLIIVDEEHDTSYKQESRFRYNARDMAVIRARQEGAVALLGSATPSMQSVYNMGCRKFHPLNLTRRIHSQTLPEIQMVDLRLHQDYRGVHRFITADLQAAMRETLDRGEQVLLFLNRRGYASYPVCANCGNPIKCRNCEITLTLHQKANAYKCHLCGFSLPAAGQCPVCGSGAIKQLGMGTEKIEDAVGKLFPDARIARMDRDTVTRKGAMVKILKGLRRREIDILVGTQMVAKGHDFPHITLVGIICADLSLSFPDFRAGELTFQVLAQVAGRAGRGQAPGRVILQTYNPDHFSIQAARKQDYKSFYSQEIRIRKDFSYPPFSRMIQLKISGKDAGATRRFAQAMGEWCLKIKAEDPQAHSRIDILGPIEAPVPKIANRFRWQILLKSGHTETLHRFVRKLMSDHNITRADRQVQVGIDVDPFFLM